MTFLEPVNKLFAPDEFHAYLKTVGPLRWWPSFCVLHAVAVPLTTWRLHPVTVRVPNIWVGYRAAGWHGGPHVVVDETGICVGNPIDQPGVHSPSWNGISFGIEQAGLYQPGEDTYPDTIRDNAVAAIASLNLLVGAAPASLKYHYEDLRTTHQDCPCPRPDRAGHQIIPKSDMIARIAVKMDQLRGTHP